MTCKEQQEEELEVLHSIYEGDENFKEINATTFQYKFGEDGNYKSFIVEVSWSDNYPDEEPQINLNTFYNKHILDTVKDKILEGLNSQIPDLLGCAMTYTLFEWVKENLDDLIIDQPDAPVIAVTEEKEIIIQEEGKKKEKKEQLSKNQKRKMYDRLNAAGERPRGYDWVDVIRHLSQTGSK